MVIDFRTMGAILVLIVELRLLRLGKNPNAMFLSHSLCIPVIEGFIIWGGGECLPRRAEDENMWVSTCLWMLQ